MNITPAGESEAISGINVTPLVDVSLVLVLIFLVSSPIFVKALAPVDLPQANSASAEDHKNITVTISPKDGISVNENQVTREMLSGALKKQKQDTGFDFLLIRADASEPYGNVEDIMKIGKELGFRRIAFATEPKRG